jgi:arylsulfatase A-like enzyme
MSAPKPNILWIVTTQWRAQACGYAGDPNARTPWLDALAAESMNFTQAVTPHPFGPFARAALLTGVASPGNGVRDYFDPLRPGTRTIAHDLKAHGYATAYFGKWHLAKRDPHAPMIGEVHARMVVPPEARGGFEVWEGFESGFLLNDPWLHGTRLREPVQMPGYQSDVVTTRAREWIEGRAAGADAAPGVPWFCVVSLEPPHPPYDAPAAGVPGRDPREIVLPANVPAGGEIEARARRELAGYYAHIEATDRAIGRMLRSKAADRDDTMVVFTSVHGDMHGAHGLFRKGWPHEESVRVPLLVRGMRTSRARGEGRGASGASDAAVSLVDLAAMTWDWASGLTPQARGHALISMPSIVALPHQCDRIWRGVRTKTRKLVLQEGPSMDSASSPPAGSGHDLRPWLFFDLEQDPLEMKNLAGDPARWGEIAELAGLAPA